MVGSVITKFLVVALLCSTTWAASKFVIGQQGESCFEACAAINFNCNPHIDTGNSSKLFQQLGINCQADPRAWWAEDQPCYVSGSTDPNYQKCLGYTDVPDGVMCGGSYPASRRLCYCDDPSDFSKVSAIGTGLSNGQVTTEEQIIFQWILPSTSHGVMTHFWATAGNGILEDTTVRYYIDGEKEASIQFIPPLACGSANDQTVAPWGTKWFGKGAKDGAWFLNFKIPFQKSIKITVQRPSGTSGGFYMIVRGAQNLPINIGGVAVPSTARLLLQRVEKTVQPLEWVPIVDLPSGSGLLFMHTLYVRSQNLNFLEGCYHVYTPYNQSFPGTVISTGTEDYFDSAWYFNAGEFRFPVAGMTRLVDTPGHAEVSAYRFHEEDPLPFANGFRYMWRNGDTVDPAGRKCYMQKGGQVVGSPTASNLVSYCWVYVW